MEFFNKNTSQGESGRYPDHTLFSPSYPEPDTVQPPTPRIILVGNFRQSWIDKSFYPYLRAEGFEVSRLNWRGAFEQIRWEQPALVLIEGVEQTVGLVKRLHSDYLTLNVGIILVLETNQIAQIAGTAKVVAVQNFQQLTQAIEHLRPLPDAFPTNIFHLQTLISDPELRCFIKQVIDAPETLQIVTWFASDLRAVGNVEMLTNLFEIHPSAANNAINRLAQAGFIEPLELETPDPFYAVVAHPDKMAVLQKFGSALTSKEYRLALTTYLLSQAP